MIKREKKRIKRIQQQNITPALKKAVWDMYVGTNTNEALCFLCGRAKLYKSKNSGWEAAHIVARRWFIGQLNRYAVVPSCQSCNNECSDMCVFDYLFGRRRYGSIRKIAWAIYSGYLEEYPEEVESFDFMAWRLIYNLFGKETYPVGGGIQSEKRIYEIIRSYQAKVLGQEIVELSQKIREKTKLVELVYNSKIDKRDLL